MSVRAMLAALLLVAGLALRSPAEDNLASPAIPGVSPATVQGDHEFLDQIEGKAPAAVPETKVARQTVKAAPAGKRSRHSVAQGAVRRQTPRTPVAAPAETADADNEPASPATRGALSPFRRTKDADPSSARYAYERRGFEAGGDTLTETTVIETPRHRSFFDRIFHRD